MLIIYIISTLEYDVDDTLIELVPKNFYLDITSFKIFKYIPSCENNILTKNIYAQIKNGELYLYYDFTNIKQDEENMFINFNEHFIQHSNLISNLNCGEEYYFVYFVRGKTTVNFSIYNCQMVIRNQDENIININPLLSNYFSFLQKIQNKEEKIYYYYNQTQYVLISFYSQIYKIQIIENNTIIYDNETKTFFEQYEFKKILIIQLFIIIRINIPFQVV